MLTQIQAWAKQPYNPNMNLTGWFLMVGAFMVAAMLWAMILGHIRGAVEAVTD